MPTVSVITPVYNRPAYLEEAIRSIQAQTFTDWEQIIIDDGSDNPDTQEVLKRCATYPKVTIYRKENAGLGAARNFGIERSTGKYILTLDDDDIWAPDFLEKAVKILDTQPEIGVVTAWAKVFGAHKGHLKPMGGGVKNFLISNNCVHALLRKECWEKSGRYDEHKFFQVYTDWDIWLRITQYGYTVKVIEENLFNYRTHRTPSMLQNVGDKHLELFRYMIEKNKFIYEQNMVDAILMFEKRIMDTRKEYNPRNLIRQMGRFLKSTLSS